MALAGAGQILEDREIPYKQLQEQRHIAGNLDIDAGQSCNQPVRRQAGDADCKTDDGGEHDTDGRDQQRVEQTDPEGLAVGGQCAVFDQRLRDIEAGRRVPETKAGGDILFLEIVDGVGNPHPEDPAEDGRNQHLIEDLTGLALIQPAADSSAEVFRAPLAVRYRHLTLSPLIPPLVDRVPAGRAGRHPSRGISGSEARTADRPCSTGC
jgi:hypothetical protein